MTTQEILDNLTMRLYKKPYDEITPEERNDLRERMEKLFTEEDTPDEGSL
jgi:hypothetical protein